jgi:hypothetical protein
MKKQLTAWGDLLQNMKTLKREIKMKNDKVRLIVITSTIITILCGQLSKGVCQEINNNQNISVAGEDTDKSALGQGSKELSGGVSISYSGGDLYEQGSEGITSVSLRPALGYFVGAGWEIGGMLVFTNTSVSYATEKNMGIGVFANHYFSVANGIASKGANYPYLGLGFSFNHNSIDVSSGFGYGYNESDNRMNLALYTGLMHLLSNAVGIYGQLEVDANSVKEEGMTTVGGYKIGIFTGFNYYLF